MSDAKEINLMSRKLGQKLDWFLSLNDIPADRLVKLASTGSAKQTAYWHANLGWALFLANHYVAAEVSFSEAMKMDETLWWPKYGMVRTSVALEKYDQAVDWTLKAKETILKQDIEDPIGFSYSAALYISKTDDFKRAIQYTRKLYEDHPKDVRAIDIYIAALYRGGHIEQVFSLLKTLNETATSEGKHTLLMELLLIGWRYMAALPLAIDSAECGQMLKTACDVLSPDDEMISNDMYSVQKLADLKCTYFGQSEKAITVWEIMLKKTDDPF